MKGGVRSSKTHMWHMILTMAALNYPGLHALVVRRHLDKLKTTAFRFNLFNPNNPHNWQNMGVVEKYWSDPMEVLFKNGSFIQYDGTFQDGREDETKFGGTDYGLIIIEEATEVGEKVFDFLVGRLSQVKPTDVPRRLFLAFNPPLKSHWLYKRFAHLEPKVVNPATFEYDENPEAMAEYKTLKKPPTQRLITFDIEHNRENLPSGFIESLEDSYREDEVRKYLRGDWGILKQGAAVHKEYVEHLHCSRMELIAKPRFPLLIGWDAHAIGLYIGVVWAQYVGPQIQVLASRLYRVGEEGSAKQIIKSVFRETAQKFRSHPHSSIMHFGDPIMTVKEKINMVSLVDILEEEGVEFQGGAISHVERREALANFLESFPGGVPAITFNAGLDTQHLREAMQGGYCYPEKDGYVTRDSPIKNPYSHEPEALQYIITGLDVLDWKKNVSQYRKEEDGRHAKGTWMSR